MHADTGRRLGCGSLQVSNHGLPRSISGSSAGELNLYLGTHIGHLLPTYFLSAL